MLINKLKNKIKEIYNITDDCFSIINNSDMIDDDNYDELHERIQNIRFDVRVMRRLLNNRGGDINST